MADFKRMSVLEALEASLEAATHLEPKHAAVVGAARALAAKIDAWDVIVQWALDDAADTSMRPRVPQNDNTSLGTYARYLEALGLTMVAPKPNAVKKLTPEPEPVEPDKPKPDSPSAKILQMQEKALARKAR